MTNRTPIGVELYDSHTGEHVCYLDTYTSEYLDSVEFMYREGNYGCDCNRLLFLARARGGEEPKVLTCSHERVFVVRVVDRSNGKELYEGDDHPLVYALGAQWCDDALVV